MKRALLTTALLVFTFTMGAQIKNVTKETKTTTVTVNNGQKVDKIVKTTKTDAEQQLEFKDADSKKLNKDVMPTPVQVNSQTTITANGTTVAEIDRSSFYMMNGQNYQFVTDRAGGYRVASPDNVNYGTMRKASNNNYIFKYNGKTSLAHFDADGNLVVETYDDNGNGVIVETYSLVKK